MLATAALHPLLPAIPLRVLRALPAPAPFSISLPFPPIFRLAPEPPRPALDPITLIAAALYLGGVALLLARLIAGYIAMRRLIHASTPVSARVREWNQLRVPMTAGFLRPVILLPENSREWSADTRLAVLAHEEAHIARGDWAIALLARINRAFFF